jgi:hypothetical protein
MLSVNRLNLYKYYILLILSQTYIFNKITLLLSFYFFLHFYMFILLNL